MCIYPSTTWANHEPMLAASRIPSSTYRYLDSSGCALDFEGMIEDLKAAPIHSIVLLHMCAHNPSGVDPSEDQWRHILSIVEERQLFPLFDAAYQGFVSGDPNIDAFPVRLFASSSSSAKEMMVACSYAKNFGLYADRIGALHVTASSPEVFPKIASQLRVISRVLYSTCPVHGARIVATILNEEARKAQWLSECKAMADRLNGVRTSLYDSLVEFKVKGTWDHVRKQRGMFSYTGLTSEVVLKLRADYHIYLLENGRISLAGLNSSNTRYFAQALAAILGTN